MNLINYIKLLVVMAGCMALGGIITAWTILRKKDQIQQHQRIEFYRQTAMRVEKLVANRTKILARGLHKVTINVDTNGPEFAALFQRLVIVTAISENHVKEAMGMIGSAQEQMPTTRIIIYDIGIRNKTIPTVKSFCNVELRRFQFKKYPHFVSNLSTYAWKIFIIKETVNEFGAIFWADASVRFSKSLEILIPFAYQHHGYLSRIHSYSAHTTKPIKHNYYMTVPKMYEAIGVDRKEFAESSNAPHPASNRQLILNGTTIQAKFLAPMYACAMNKSCISPPGAKHTVNHRFDASALMLVIYKYFPGEFSRENDHLADIDQVMYMHRASNDWSKVKTCANKSSIL